MEEGVNTLDTVEFEAFALKITRAANRSRRAGIGFISLLALPLVIHLIPGGDNASERLSQNPYLGNTLFILYLCLVGYLISVGLSHAYEDTSSWNETRYIGPLIDALSMQEGQRIQWIKTTLTQLLPHMNAGDAGRLSPQQIGRLRDVLSHSVENPLHKDIGALFSPDRKRADFQIAILKAFQQVGGEKELSVVEQLATREAKTGLQKEIREAAKECLPYLQARVEQERGRQTLLRPSESPEQTANILLRPALGSVSEDSMHLLRPKVPPE